MTDYFQYLQKLISLTGDRARLDAKANGTYIVYATNEGQIVKEYADGKIVPVENLGGHHGMISYG